MENSHQLNSLCDTCMAQLSSQLSTMPGANSLVRPKGLDMLPPTRDALELHIARANHQEKIWLQTDQEYIDVQSPIETSAWKKDSGCLKVVWTRLPPIPDACLELVTCGCKSKCRTVQCTCFRKNLKCTYACGCDAIDCCNPAGE